ncbi:MAG: DUF485 domain-containing protein [Gemmatimonadetes bacterium]|nr:DUF485 domain-containing protein [Gemmatimonadota bacterium]
MSSHALHVRRWKLALLLTGTVAAIYFGFILLIAYRKEFMGSLVMPGLSWGILLGALVIVASFLLTWWYVRWANSHYDAGLKKLREDAR